MITDDALYQLAVFLGVVAMLMIVIYHFLEINAQDDGKAGKAAPVSNARKVDSLPPKAR
ncbi:hypothetical protein K470DRAFT_216024 [Piedraia hortae CBS 480.64]|uniref:Dolichyl-diphosphooligosaccharide--protein glycosyltransferase subunit 4 n=1 Tax=Piedraia hortae CBS 480.64 TaxID=1314780 RepID=A0A6A7C1Y2_9PEZI|nr:hypothetical protein K470DRAFT_216024 [Piedraia hortae CBS 480.64]